MRVPILSADRRGRSCVDTDAATCRQRLGNAFKQATILRPGLSLHLGDMREPEDAVGHSIDRDHLRIVLVLEGALDVAYAGHRLRLQAPRVGIGAAAAVDTAMISMGTPTEFQRRALRGDYARRLSIGAGREWIEQSIQASAAAAMPGTERFLELPLATRCWRASAYARALAEQILSPPPLADAVASLYLESRVIGLIVEALSGPSTFPRPERALRPAMHRRMYELKAYLESNAGRDDLDMSSLARHTGFSVSTLQRNFRQTHGLTISAFVQQVRLGLARHALECEGVSVARAALMAGYANPANFATAFRRRYGVAPRQLRTCLSAK